MRAILAVLLLAGCASPPTHYERQSWARVGFKQAEAQCYYEINQPSTQGSLYLCMQSKGWDEVYDR